MASITLRSWALPFRPCTSLTNFKLLATSVGKPPRQLSNSFFKQNTSYVRSQSTSWTWSNASVAFRAWKSSTPGSYLTECLVKMSTRSRAGTYRSRPTAQSSSSSSSSSQSAWRGRTVRSPGDPPPPHGPSGNSGPSLLARLRRQFNLQPPELLVWTIIGLNAGIYFAWQFAVDQMKAGKPSTVKWMLDNVMLSWRNIREGRIWTLITATFSHNTAGHILLNCFSFYTFAPSVISLIGNSAFMGLYFFGGIVCSLTSLAFNPSVRYREGGSHGASGAIFAVSSFFACCFPRTKFLIFFVIPCPAWLVITGLFLYDGIATIQDRERRTDGAGHIGGIIAGVAYYLVKRRLLF